MWIRAEWGTELSSYLFIANTVTDSEIACLVLEIINNEQECYLFLDIW